LDKLNKVKKLKDLTFMQLFILINQKDYNN